MKIAEIIKNENLENLEERELLRREITQYLQTNPPSRQKKFNEQDDQRLSPELLDTFLRNQERQENSKRILQYMLSFLSEIPEPKKISKEPVNPVKQFKEFLQYQVSLLNEKDVISAISREFNRQSLNETNNSWFYKARIMDKRLELEHMLSQVSEDQTATHLILFRILELLCLFWFDIVREDVRQARRSDIYMYKLARLLQNKLRAKRKNENP